MPTSADLPIWVKYVAIFAPLFVTAVAARFAIYYSRRQAEYARQRLKLDMFDRRYTVYKAIKTSIFERTARGTLTSDDIGACNEIIDGSEYLFEGETRAFLGAVSTILHNAWSIEFDMEKQNMLVHDEAEVPDGAICVQNMSTGEIFTRNTKLEGEEKEIADFLDSFGENLDAHFEPYLDLSKIGLVH
jgi:hypothetical protein